MILFHVYSFIVANRLITEKFKEMEKTYKVQMQQEQTAKATKTTVKGSTSLLESSMKTSPLQSMVWTLRGLMVIIYLLGQKFEF